jgi:RNA-binding protein with serine-rich domain 1
MPINRQCKYNRSTSERLLFCTPQIRVSNCYVVNTNRGTAYILFYSAADAEAAIAHMHEAQLDGAVINVSIVVPRRKFSRSPPPARRVGPSVDRYDPRPGPLAVGYRGSISGLGGTGGGRYRSPPPIRRSPPRRYGRSDPRGSNMDTYRPRSYSRPRSARTRSPRSRSRSFTSRSRSRSPYPRRRGGGGRRESPPRVGRRRRSPSYSSYSSFSERSRSLSRARGRTGRGRR